MRGLAAFRVKIEDGCTMVQVAVSISSVSISKNGTGSACPTKHRRSSHCANRKDGSLCYFSIKENKRLVLLDGIKLAGAKAEQRADFVLTTTAHF